MDVIRIFAERRRRIITSKLIARGLTLGNDVHLHDPACLGPDPSLITIGNNVIIEEGVRFLTDEGTCWADRTRPMHEDTYPHREIAIHDNCYISFRSIIHTGVSIGPNSIVTPGAVVTRDVPPGTVVEGNPARVTGTVEDYADECAQSISFYDQEALRKNKKDELLRMFPRPW